MFWAIYWIGYLLCFISVMTLLYRISGQIRVGDALVCLFVALLSWIIPVGILLSYLFSIIPFEKVLIEKKKKDK